MSSSPSPSNRPGPLLVVLSGPSGAGKDALLSRMRQLRKPYHYTITATTRPQRPTERDGVDYIFVTEESFRRMIERDELLEWAEVYGNLYGVPRDRVAEALRSGRDVIIKTDVQGAATIRKLAPGAILIFIAPPDMEELARRLGQRMTEAPEALWLRLSTAEREMQASSGFDHVVVNHPDRLDDAVEEIEAILASERRRPRPRAMPL